MDLLSIGEYLRSKSELTTVIFKTPFICMVYSYYAIRSSYYMITVLTKKRKTDTYSLQRRFRAM